MRRSSSIWCHCRLVGWLARRRHGLSMLGSASASCGSTKADRMVGPQRCRRYIEAPSRSVSARPSLGHVGSARLCTPEDAHAPLDLTDRTLVQEHSTSQVELLGRGALTRIEYKHVLSNNSPGSKRPASKAPRPLRRRNVSRPGDVAKLGTVGDSFLLSDAVAATTTKATVLSVCHWGSDTKPPHSVEPCVQTIEVRAGSLGACSLDPDGVRHLGGVSCASSSTPRSG
jgi:hypothetical protein